MTTKETLHQLVDALPDDVERLQEVKELIVEHLRLWDAATRKAEERGWEVATASTAGGGVSPDKRSLTKHPVLRAIEMAPADDEPSTPEEDTAVEEAWQAYRRGEYVSNEDLRREIGW